jgi:hypothetical protein
MSRAYSSSLSRVSSRHSLCQRLRQRHVRLSPHRNVLVLFRQQITNQPPKNHAPPLIQMRPVVGQIVVSPAGIGPDRINVIRTSSVQINPARSQGLGHSYRGVALVGEVFHDTWWRAGERAAGQRSHEDGFAVGCADFFCEVSEVGREV